MELSWVTLFPDAKERRKSSGVRLERSGREWSQIQPVVGLRIEERVEAIVIDLVALVSGIELL